MIPNQIKPRYVGDGMDIFSRIAGALQYVLNDKADELAKKTTLSNGNVKSRVRAL